MHHAPHTGGFAGTGNFVGQLHMRCVEGGFVALQDRHQIDHGVMPTDELLQRGFIMDVGLDNIQRGQHEDVVGVATPARWHGDTHLRIDQLFADVPTDKTRAAKDEYFLNHGVILPFCREHSNADAIAPDFFIRRQLGHGPLKADLPFFEHVGAV